jgi:hypothetical protein
VIGEGLNMSFVLVSEYWGGKNNLHVLWHIARSLKGQDLKST